MLITVLRPSGKTFTAKTHHSIDGDSISVCDVVSFKCPSYINEVPPSNSVIFRKRLVCLLSVCLCVFSEETGRMLVVIEKREKSRSLRSEHREPRKWSKRFNIGVLFIRKAETCCMERACIGVRGSNSGYEASFETLSSTQIQGNFSDPQRTVITWARITS